MSQRPDATDSEFYENVLMPLALGRFHECLVVIKRTKDSELYLHYSGDNETDEEGLCDAADLTKETAELIEKLKDKL